MSHDKTTAIDSPPVTEQLCEWATSLTLEDVPHEVQQRAKHLILDAIGCGLVGAHVPWSEDALNAMATFEAPGNCSLIGWSDKAFGPLAAALLNGTFIQALELDDYHSAAPLHSGSIIVPALMAAGSIASTEPRSYSVSDQPTETPERNAITGKDFLLAAIVGFESGPRIGNALHGIDFLNRGWHSGPIFGAPAAALATAKLLRLSAAETSSAISIACTQAGGLMAAQYGGTVKRMQHAFAARNGLLGALLARGGYGGFPRALERPHGGFLAMFSSGTSMTPQFLPEEVVKELGTFWQTPAIRVKLHACVGACHGLIECLAGLQAKYPEWLGEEADLEKIEKIVVEFSEGVFLKAGWPPESRPLSPVAAQMCAPYIAATQLVDQQVLLAQFSSKNLNRDAVWDLISKTECVRDLTRSGHKRLHGATVKITVRDGSYRATSGKGGAAVTLENAVDAPRGFDPPVSDLEIEEKFQRLTGGVMDEGEAREVLDYVLRLEGRGNVRDLTTLLASDVENALA